CCTALDLSDAPDLIRAFAAKLTSLLEKPCAICESHRPPSGDSAPSCRLSPMWHNGFYNRSQKPRHPCIRNSPRKRDKSDSWCILSRGKNPSQGSVAAITAPKRLSLPWPTPPWSLHKALFRRHFVLRRVRILI